MSCPNWVELLELRERLEGASPDGWSERWEAAVGHLQGCPRCRAEAVRIDPSLIFVTRPALEVSDDEVAGMVAGVRTLRRARQAEETLVEPRRRWARFAAAAAAVVLMVLLSNVNPRQAAPPLPATPQLASDATATPGSILGDGPAPVIEPLDLPLARIYQLGEEDLSVVMVVDESLDV